jgi:hypothetical protein
MDNHGMADSVIRNVELVCDKITVSLAEVKRVLAAHVITPNPRFTNYRVAILTEWIAAATSTIAEYDRVKDGDDASKQINYPTLFVMIMNVTSIAQNIN